MSEHHHKETFVTKYIFSQDHKMISKQFLITGIIMGVIGVLMSYVVSFATCVARPFIFDY